MLVQFRVCAAPPSQALPPPKAMTSTERVRTWTPGQQLAEQLDHDPQLLYAQSRFGHPTAKSQFLVSRKDESHVPLATVRVRSLVPLHLSTHSDQELQSLRVQFVSCNLWPVLAKLAGSELSNSLTCAARGSERLIIRTLDLPSGLICAIQDFPSLSSANWPSAVTRPSGPTAAALEPYDIASSELEVSCAVLQGRLAPRTSPRSNSWRP